VRERTIPRNDYASLEWMEGVATKSRREAPMEDKCVHDSPKQKDKWTKGARNLRKAVFCLTYNGFGTQDAGDARIKVAKPAGLLQENLKNVIIDLKLILKIGEMGRH